MPSITITVSTEAHKRLKKLKEGGESFSDVILREVPEKANTFGDLEKLMQDQTFPSPDPKLMRAVRGGRGRRSRTPR